MAIHCSSCGYDNDTTRIFCHNCGVKLDRTATPAPSPVTVTRPTDVAKMKRARKPLEWSKSLAFLAKFLVLAAVAAALAAALVPPRNVPPPAAPDENLATRLSALINDASSADSPRSFAVPAPDVNRWLVSVAKFAAPEGPVQINPKRVYAVQGAGTIRVGLEGSLLGVADLYFEGDYAPVANGNGGYSLEPVRYSIGRLPLPVALGWPVERQLSGLGDALAVPLAQLAKASHIEVAPDQLTLSWTGAPPR